VQQDLHKSTKQQKGIAAKKEGVGGNSEGQAHQDVRANTCTGCRQWRDWSPSRELGGQDQTISSVRAEAF